MYTLLNQAALSELPGHPPFDVWQIGTEMFRQLGVFKQRVIRRADRVFSISAHTAELAARHTPGLRAGVVVRLCAEPSDSATLPYRAGEREPAVLIVGNMHRGLMYKGHQQLIAAWPQVAAICPTAQLWIVGQGNGEPLLRQQAAMLRARVSQRIHFLGPLGESELQRRYQTARVFAMPSTGEGFGLVFVEAARHGVPCIAGKYDSAREIILHNRTGLLCDQHPHDVAVASIRLLTDDAMADRLGETGRQRYENHFRFPHFRQRLLTSMGLAC